MNINLILSYVISPPFILGPYTSLEEVKEFNYDIDDWTLQFIENRNYTLHMYGFSYTKYVCDIEYQDNMGSFLHDLKQLSRRNKRNEY